MYNGLKIKKEKLNYFIWFVPIISLLIAGSLVYNTWYNKGPVVTLYLKKADGLEAGKTLIKSLNIDVGKIVSISLAKDQVSVVAKAQLTKEAEQLLYGDSVFWIQKPRMGNGGISGLNTILSGYYIELSPGKEGDALKAYNVLEDPPFDLKQAGISVELRTNSNKDLAIGDIVNFKGLNAGFIYEKKYNFEERELRYKAFITEPYSKLISPQTFFWINNGISFSFGSEGLRVDTDTIQSMLKGGVSFDIPPESEASVLAKDHDYIFRLFDNRGRVETRYLNAADFVVLTDSVSKGLVDNAPIFYRGLQVGVVKKAPYLRKDFEIFKEQEDFYAYLISIQPERFDKTKIRTSQDITADIVSRLEQNDLAAVVENLSFITGKSYINLIDVKDAKKLEGKKLSKYDGYIVIPSLENEFDSMQQSLSKLSQNLAKLKVDELVDNMNTLLKKTSHTSDDISDLCKTMRILFEKLDKNEASEEIVKTLKETQKLLRSYGEKGELYQDLRSSMKNIDNTLILIDPVLKKLDQKSNSLIFEYKASDPVPRAK